MRLQFIPAFFVGRSHFVLHFLFVCRTLYSVYLMEVYYYTLAAMLSISLYKQRRKVLDVAVVNSCAVAHRVADLIRRHHSVFLQASVVWLTWRFVAAAKRLELLLCSFKVLHVKEENHDLDDVTERL